MKVKDRISYYCFNKKCTGSVYFHKTIKIAFLPLTTKTLTQEQYCNLCGEKIISVLDIELRQALYAKKQSDKLSAEA